MPLGAFYHGQLQRSLALVFDLRLDYYDPAAVALFSGNTPNSNVYVSVALQSERYGDGRPDPRVFVYAAGGYYYPGKGLDQLKREMQGYLERGYTVAQVVHDYGDICQAITELAEGRARARSSLGRVPADTAERKSA